ncbi:hypothetical protein OROMI_031180 [Orobanche minor]
MKNPSSSTDHHPCCVRLLLLFVLVDVLCLFPIFVTYHNLHNVGDKDVRLLVITLLPALRADSEAIIEAETTRRSLAILPNIRVIPCIFQARTCVRTPVGDTLYFPVEIELHQGSALSPLLFALIIDVISRGIQDGNYSFGTQTKQIRPKSPNLRELRKGTVPRAAAQKTGAAAQMHTGPGHRKDETRPSQNDLSHPKSTVPWAAAQETGAAAQTNPGPRHANAGTRPGHDQKITTSRLYCGPRLTKAGPRPPTAFVRFLSGIWAVLVLIKMGLSILDYRRFKAIKRRIRPDFYDLLEEEKP